MFKKLIQKSVNFGRKLTLKTKVIALLIVAAYIAIILVSNISYISGRDVINKRITAELSLTSQNISDSVNRLIYERYNDLQNLISDSTLSDPNANNEAKTDVLRSSLVKLGWYDNIHLTDANGEIIASTLKNAVGTKVDDESWYESTQSEFIAVSDVVESEFTGKETLIFANTVADKVNTPIGIIFAEFSWRVVEDQLKRSEENTEVMIFSKSGEILAYKGNLTSIDNLSLNEINDLDRQKQFFTQRLESEGYLGFKGNGWEFIVQIPKSVAYEPLTRFTNILWITVIGISILVFVIGSSAAKSITKPINTLTEGVEKIKSGDLKHKITVQTEDEIGFLADHFNEMSASLLEKTNYLLEERGKYKSILDSANEGIVLLDLEDKVIAYNQTFKKVLGIKKNDIIGLEPDEIFKFLAHKENAAGNSKQFAQIRKLLASRKNRKTAKFELTLLKPSFKVLNVYTTSVETEKKNMLLGRIWVFTDVTEEKSAEQIKNDFIKVASHKLRTPITVVNWSAQLLFDGALGKLNKKQKQTLEQVMISADKLNYLVNMLMNAAEIQKKSIKPVYSTFNLIDIIKQVLKDANHYAQERPSLKIEFKKPSDKVEIKADSNKIWQVLSVLVENAIFYTDENRKNNVVIEVKTNKKKKTAVITVTDTGIGIEAKDKQKVFTKFFRGEQAFLKYPDGAGLGLYLSKLIINSHKQKIWFDSVDGKGSSFSFTIDLA